MPDAWELLKAASPSIINGDAWTRLNNLEGDGATWVGYDLKEGLEVELDMHCIEVEIDEGIEIEIDQGIEVEVDPNEIEVEICQ